MKLEGTADFAVTSETLWSGLTNPELMKSLIKGCEALTGNLETGYEGSILYKIGPFTKRFKGEIFASDVIEGEQYRLKGGGIGKLARLAQGEALIKIAPTEQGARLTYTADLALSSALTKLGGTAIESYGTQVARDFFKHLEDALIARN